MRTAILVLSIIGVVFSVAVGACTGACFSGLGDMSQSFGDYSTANQVNSAAGNYFLLALIQAGIGLFGGVYSYRNWQLPEKINLLNKISLLKVKFGALLLIVAALFSIHNTVEFFTAGVLFAVAALLTFIKGRESDMVK